MNGCVHVPSSSSSSSPRKGFGDRGPLQKSSVTALGIRQYVVRLKVQYEALVWGSFTKEGKELIFMYGGCWLTSH